MPPAELDRVFNNTASKKRCVVPGLFSVEMGAMYVDLLCHVLTLNTSLLSQSAILARGSLSPRYRAPDRHFLRSALNILTKCE
jgi:hypothetical protein